MEPHPSNAQPDTEPDRVNYSVVTPVHNGIHYIHRAIESAVLQQHASEIIVCDDGSRDGSGAAASAASSRVTVLTNAQALGPSGARNRAIAHASTSLIAFLDADDRWVPGKLDKQLRLLDAHPELVAVFSDFSTVDTAGRPMGWQGGILKQLRELGADPQPARVDGYILKGSVAEALIRHTSFMHPSSVVARREALLQAGGFDPAFTAAEDLDLWIRLALVGPIGYTDECLVIVESRPDSQGHKTLNMCDSLVRLYSAFETRLPNLSDSTRTHVRAFLEQKYVTLGWLQVHEAGDLAAAQRSYREALRYRWSLRSALALLKVSLARLLPRSVSLGRSAKNIGSR